VLAPQEEVHFIFHNAPQLAKIIFGQLLEVQARALIDLEIKWIELRYQRRHVFGDAQFDRGGPRRRFKLLTQLLAEIRHQHVNF
jgi:hypothetical protein